MRGFRLFERPLSVFSKEPPLMIEGVLPFYEPDVAYEGRLDIINAVGKCVVEIVEDETYLPPGATAHVDNFLQQIVLRWPAYSPPEDIKESILNWNFEEGDLTGWHDLRGGWHVGIYDHTENSEYPTGTTNPYPPPDGNHAAYMTGAGRGDWILESDPYPVKTGQRVWARSLWDQGPSNKDNNNLYTALGLYRNGVFIEELRGSRIHDRTNKARHWSEVEYMVDGAVEEVTIRLIAGRRNSRNRVIIVDDVETEGLSYSLGTSEDQEYRVKFKVTDSANRVAYWSGIVTEYYIYFTSRPYALEVLESAEGVGASALTGYHKDGFSLLEAVSAGSVALVSGSHREPVLYHDMPTDSAEALGVSLVSGRHNEPRRTTGFSDYTDATQVVLVSGTFNRSRLPYDFWPTENIEATAVSLTGGYHE